MERRERLLACLRTWATETSRELKCGAIYVFGSSVYLDGKQFNNSSDVDLVIVFPEDCDSALVRTAWTTKLLKRKHTLELELLQLLDREDASKPIVSIILTTRREINHDIHKSGSRNFFQKNKYLDLLSGDLLECIPHAGFVTDKFSDQCRQVIQFVQTVRNKFLSITPNGRRSDVFRLGEDPLPKEFQRFCAMIAAENHDVPVGQEFDLKEGLDYITNLLYNIRKLDHRYQQLNDFVSNRRGSRGIVGSINDDDYLILCELLFDDIVQIYSRKDIATNLTKDGVIRRSDYVEIDGRRTQIFPINGFKLFYYRNTRKLTIPELDRLTGIGVPRIRRLERMKRPLKVSVESFVKCSLADITKLEQALGCAGQLQSGRPDDFQTHFILFYNNHRGEQSQTRTSRTQKEISFRTKVVIFDFDGTLTRRDIGLTTWEQIWVDLGYSVNECGKYFLQFRDGKITHQEWCDITCDHFQRKSFNRDHLTKLSTRIELMPGVSDLINNLDSKDIKMYILSGSIREIIINVLGDLSPKFERIQANRMRFSESGVLSKIEGTLFDFEGKATFISDIAKSERCSPIDVLYVGNSVNDAWAFRSGARTLCVNPRFTDPTNEQMWTYRILRMEDAREILEFVNL